MQFTSVQVGQVLGVSKNVVNRLVREGHLTPVNTRGEGAATFFKKFDAKAVRDFARGPWKELSAKPLSTRALRHASGNGHALIAAAVGAAGGEHAPAGIVARLARIEEKLDRLLALWS